MMVEAEPERFTINSRKNVRRGKIYLDYLRNGQTASAIAPYSTRARERAPVSEPIDWNELSPLTSGAAFNMDAALKRFRKDPWKAIERVKQALPLKHAERRELRRVLTLPQTRHKRGPSSWRHF